MLRLAATLLFAALSLSSAACGGHDGPAVSKGATIKSVSFHTTTVAIGGAPVLFDITLHNPSATMISPFLVQGWARIATSPSKRSGAQSSPPSTSPTSTTEKRAAHCAPLRFHPGDIDLVFMPG